MHDAQGVELSAPAETSYLHGGYGGLLAGLERAVEGKAPGETVQVQLEPEDAFGEYDADLVRLEPAERYGEGIAVGMEVEEDGSLYTRHRRRRRQGGARRQPPARRHGAALRPGSARCKNCKT